MSQASLAALATLREYFKRSTEKEVPEGYKSVTNWATDWSMSYPQSRRILERGVKEGVVEVKVINVNGHDVKYYCVGEKV